MIRDRIKTEEYFQEDRELYLGSLNRRLAKYDKIKPENKSVYFRNLVIDNETLFKICYSIGDSVQTLFPYYQGILSNLKEVASEGVPFYRAVDVFALGVFFTVSARESF